jgi:hypothetical protein
VSSSRSATPKLAVILTILPAASICVSAIRCRNRSAHRAAPSSLACGSSTQNSSPPNRQM